MINRTFNQNERVLLCMENTETNAQTHTNVASASSSSCICNVDALAFGLKGIDAKATRYIASTYKVHASQLETLSILWLWLRLTGKQETGGAYTAFISWSGARWAWKKRMRIGVQEGIEQGIIERIEYQKGVRLKVSQKGLYVLGKWVERMQELNATWLQNGI